MAFRENPWFVSSQKLHNGSIEQCLKFTLCSLDVQRLSNKPFKHIFWLIWVCTATMITNHTLSKSADFWAVVESRELSCKFYDSSESGYQMVEKHFNFGRARAHNVSSIMAKADTKWFLEALRYNIVGYGSSYFQAWDIVYLSMNFRLWLAHWQGDSHQMESWQICSDYIKEWWWEAFCSSSKDHTVTMIKAQISVMLPG